MFHVVKIAGAYRSAHTGESVNVHAQALDALDAFRRGSYGYAEDYVTHTQIGEGRESFDVVVTVASRDAALALHALACEAGAPVYIADSYVPTSGEILAWARTREAATA